MFAMFFQLKTIFEFLFIFLGVVSDTFARGALKLDKIVL
jgi:hypothetical protein